MGVDLFLNGHDHIYIRSTVKNDIKVNTGDGTTYLTGGTVGNKFYEYMPARSDYSTDFYTDEEDKQVFSIIEFNEDSIKGTAYQKQDADRLEQLQGSGQLRDPQHPAQNGKSGYRLYRRSGERMVLQGGGLRHQEAVCSPAIRRIRSARARH